MKGKVNDFNHATSVYEISHHMRKHKHATDQPNTSYHLAFDWSKLTSFSFSFLPFFLLPFFRLLVSWFDDGVVLDGDDDGVVLDGDDDGVVLVWMMMGCVG